MQTPSDSNKKTLKKIDQMLEETDELLVDYYQRHIRFMARIMNKDKK